MRKRKNTKRWPNVGLMLVQRLRRWPSIKPTLGERLVFVGSALCYFTFTVYWFRGLPYVADAVYIHSSRDADWGLHLHPPPVPTKSNPESASFDNIGIGRPVTWGTGFMDTRFLTLQRSQEIGGDHFVFHVSICHPPPPPLNRERIMEYEYRIGRECRDYFYFCVTRPR